MHIHVYLISSHNEHDEIMGISAKDALCVAGSSRKGPLSIMSCSLGDFQEMPLTADDFPLSNVIEKCATAKLRLYLMTKYVVRYLII